MSMTLATLRQHKRHLANAMEHVIEICRLEESAGAKLSEMHRLALENHDDLLRWELSQAESALSYCQDLNLRDERKRQRVANIAFNRFTAMARQLEGSRLP